MIALRFLLIFLSVASLSARASAQQNHCYSTAETRENIAANGLSEPFRPLQRAAARFQAEPIAAKLCRVNDVLVYEISLLRRDGKIVRSFLDAKTGQLIEAMPAARPAK